MTIPGMQKPHCTAPASAKQCSYTRISAGSMPSTVTTFLPARRLRDVTQALTFFPSTSTVQVPQTPSLQPSLAAVRPKSSRRNASSFLSWADS